MDRFNFSLPDLGEGLPDAIVVAWHVKLGEAVKIDQLLVSVETAKAIVDIPAPVNGIVEKLYANINDRVSTGALLVTFKTNLHDDNNISIKDNQSKINYADDINNSKILAVPAVRSLAKKLNVNLNTIIPTGKFNTITINDVKLAASKLNMTDQPLDWSNIPNTTKTMAITMQKSHQEIVPATIFDDAIFTMKSNHTQNPKLHNNLTTNLNIKIIEAIKFALTQEPILNSWIIKEPNNHKFIHKIIKEINLGIAVDTANGLFVPVINNIAQLESWQISDALAALIKKTHARTILPTELQSATFVLSNFGKFGGRYATPIIIPPTVSILAVGKLYKTIVINHDTALTAKHTNLFDIGYALPLSLTFDHRVITGGQAARFLQWIIEFLNKNFAKVVNYNS